MKDARSPDCGAPASFSVPMFGRAMLFGRMVLVALSMAAIGLLCAPLHAPGAAAKDNKNSGSYSRNYNYYSQQSLADMERQRKQQEKAMQAAIKAMQEAQKAAMRNMQKSQSQISIPKTPSYQQPAYQQPSNQQPSYQQPKTTQQQAPSKAAPVKQANDKDDDDKADKTPDANRIKADKGTGSADDGDGDEGDDDDIFLSDTERQLRMIEKARQRALMQAARDQQALQQKEEERAARIRERTAKRILDEHNRNAAASGKAGSVGKDGAAPGTAAGADKTSPQKWPVSVEHNAPDGKDNPLQKQVAEPRTKWLDMYERRASGLGMGREVIKKAAEQAVPANGKDGQPQPAGADKDADEAPANAPDTKTPDTKTVRADGLKEARRGLFPGKELGAELPVDMFAAERAHELIATGLTAVDRATAEAHGFIVSQPVELKGLGKAVQRITGPAGVNRDEAERELHKILPFLSVTPNQAHDIFVGSLGETERSTGQTPPGPNVDKRAVSAASPQPCPHQTCFGSELIKWKSALGSCAKGVRIGIIDTSFDIGHPALEHINVEQGEFLDGMPASPYDWHGTAVLSLLAGDPRSGTPGLVPDATFLLATAFRSDAAGNASTDTVRLLSALAWLEGLDVDIVNMSFSGPRDEAISRAIARMSEKGIVFIAAAGNGGPIAGPSYPAAYPSVVAVTAVNRNGENYRNANRGNYIDVAAPGVDILTALPDAKQGYRTGTSFAAPFVTAILATRGSDLAAMSASKARLLQQVSTQDLGPPGRDPIYGAGLALAPQRCHGGGGGAVARATPPALKPAAPEVSTAPEADSWSSQTTLIKAGTAAGFAP